MCSRPVPDGVIAQSVSWTHACQEIAELKDSNAKLKRLAVRLKADLKDAQARIGVCERGGWGCSMTNLSLLDSSRR
jgi:hypothetical protein